MKNKETLTKEEPIKDEDGYVDDWQIRKYSDCHPSSAVRVYTEQETQKSLSLKKKALGKKLLEELEISKRRLKYNGSISDLNKAWFNRGINEAEDLIKKHFNEEVKDK